MPSLSKEKAREKANAIRKAKKINPAKLDKILDIQKTEDPPRKSWHRTLFEGNELLPVSKKMTNAEIERQVRLEFPHEKVLLENLDTGRQSVNYYRHLFNKGRMTKKVTPESISFRYNDKGQIVSTRSGRLFLEFEKSEYMAKYE